MVAVINDLSGFGKCSLVADIAVLSAMGIEVCPVPTAILSAQTGFLSYHMIRGSKASKMISEYYIWKSSLLEFPDVVFRNGALTL